MLKEARYTHVPIYTHTFDSNKNNTVAFPGNLLCFCAESEDLETSNTKCVRMESIKKTRMKISQSINKSINQILRKKIYVKVIMARTWVPLN